MFNYAKLEGKIKEVCGSQKAFADSMGVSMTTVSNKLNHKSDWTQKEIGKACVVLRISSDDIPIYFFAS